MCSTLNFKSLAEVFVFIFVCYVLILEQFCGLRRRGKKASGHPALVRCLRSSRTSDDPNGFVIIRSHVSEAEEKSLASNEAI